MRVILAALLPVVAAAQFAAESRTIYTVADGLPSNDVRSIYLFESQLVAETAGGAVMLRYDGWKPVVSGLGKIPRSSAGGGVAEARPDGLFIKSHEGAT